MAQDYSNPELSILNRHASTIQGVGLLHELVQVSSERPAIDFLENGSIRRIYSYSTLHDLSNKLARTILNISREIGNSSPVVPVLLPQCPELYITMLAVLKAGKAFCPLNVDTPVERLKFILEDLSAGLLISASTRSLQVVAETEVRHILVDSVLVEQEKQPTSFLPPVNTNDVAYVLYTSGSTGVPKAVSVSHRAVVQSLLAHDEHIPDFDRFLQFAAPTFDVSIFEIYFTWFRRATLAGCTRAHMLDDLPKCIQDLDVDAAELTPTVVSNLLPTRSRVPGLKLLLTIGEMLHQRIIDEYGGDDNEESVLWAMYGPTEAAVHCTLQPGLSKSSPVTTIGFPLSTVTALVVSLDAHLGAPNTIEILPKGEVGELVLGGPQIAEGYVNRTELTATSFINHPDFGRLYRTGDLARIGIENKLEYQGRVIAGQIKIRGQRVELGEIEKTVLRVDGCRTATAIIIQGNLVVFCAAAAHIFSKFDVLQTCRQWLPEFMVPSDVCIVSHMPQLPSGKIDNNALESTYIQKVKENNVISIGEKDQTTETVLQILRQMTNHKIELGSDLAFMGVDSLQSIRLASMLRQEGYKLSALDVLTTKSLEDLIKLIRDSALEDESCMASLVPEALSVGTDFPELKSYRKNIDYLMPCTPLQEAMLAKTIARPSAYCNWIEFELSKSYGFAQIRNALLNLTKSNEILRTGFHSESSSETTFMQVVWKDLLTSQIREVGDFSRAFSLGSNESLLRPLNIQVKPGPGPSRVLMQIHHALYDGWSVDLLLGELTKLFHGEKPASKPQFRDIVQYYSRRQRFIEEKTHKEYWKSLLHDSVLKALPNYNGRIVDNQSVCTIARRSTISIDSVLKCARELSVNPQVFFQAATAYILSLYLGSLDVILGNVTSGRTLPVTRVEDVLGPCIASLPFRLDFQHLPRVRDILLKTQALNRESLSHCTLPLREITKAANGQPGAPLFEVLFVWQQSLTYSPTATSEIKIVDSADDTEYKITVEFEPHENFITSRVTFDSSTIPKKQAILFSQQIDEVVALFLQDTQCETSNINRCFSVDTHSIANPSPCRTNFSHGPAHSVEKWASISPDKDALVFAHIVDGVIEIKDTMNYGALNKRANQLSRVLKEHGAGKDHLLAIIMEKSVDMYVSILAVAKIGAGYLPLVPDTPTERVQAIFKDARIVLCISESSVSGRLRKHIPVKFLELDLIDSSQHSSMSLDVPYDGSHLAYAVFTSGTTGKPKGILITQENLMSNLDYLSSIYPYTTNSRMLQASSQAFDVSVFEIFFSWHVGICLCAAKNDDLFHDLEGNINILGVTHLSLTPTVAALVEPDNVPKVRLLVTSGEAVTERVRRKWAGRGLYQGYGPSETTNICTMNPCVGADDLINNIGPPFDNTSAFVLDPKSDVILPRGAIGELCFGGAQVFREFLNSPSLNAAKIIEHQNYGRIYRSGDLGILLFDDSILFAGRSDSQVKIRGQRVELGEITSVMLDHEKVKDCATLFMPRFLNTTALVGFWVPKTCIDASATFLNPEKLRSVTLELFSVLSRHLPAYMIPSFLVPISSIPMTAQAKIDERRLRNMFNELPQDTLYHFAESQDAEEHPTVWSDWEKEVAMILAQLLGLPLEDIQRASPFLSLGMDSVSAIAFCNKLRNANLGSFTVSDVLKSKTVARLASTTDTTLSPSPVSEISETELDQVFDAKQILQILSLYKTVNLPVVKVRPCTPLQEAMLSAEQSTLGQAYSNLMVFSVQGNISRVRECWSLMSQRHEILRTSFISTEDSRFAFVQVVLDDYDIPWYNAKWSGDLVSRTNDVLSNLRNANKPPCFLRLTEGGMSKRLIFCCHHALYDGIAVAALLREIEDHYHGYELLPPLNYDLYLQHMVAQDVEKANHYWGAIFKDFEPTIFPNLSGRASKIDHDSSSVRRRLQLPLNEIRQACKAASTSLLSVVQAAWAKMLYFYTGENDICFGNVVSGRSLPGPTLDQLVAPCFNTLPVRINFDFCRENLSLMEHLHDLNIGSLDFQLTPLRQIQNLTLKGNGRLFDTLVILQQPSQRLDDSIWTLEQEVGIMDLPIVCEVFQDAIHDTLELVLHYQNSLLSEVDAVVVAKTFDICVTSMIKYPQASANDPIGFPSNLRAEKNLKFRSLESAPSFLHSGFERNARLQPNFTALDFLQSNGRRVAWTFEVLNNKANSIAWMLIDHGVRPEDIIPIHMSKSPQFYASILGVLKSGAAFAPTYPELPEALKQFMLKELNAPVILCAESSPLPMDDITANIINVDALKPNNGGNPVVNDLWDTNLAYCLFSSGSTGTPKAIAMEHRSPIQTIESSRSFIPWTSSSRLLQYAAVTFDMCYYDCFLAWTLGFTLCAAGQSETLNELPKVINTLDVDLLDLTPSVALTLKRSQVPSVRWLCCIGEALSSEIIQEWDGIVVNSYGPAEAAFCTTMHSVTKDVNISVIGQPFPTTTFAVFSSQGDRPLPLLGAGELYIGGAQLARSYYGKPLLTDQRFVTKCGQRFHKSGDLVRMLSNGTFEFIGRTDDQVKIRGQRVELGEINHVLRDAHSRIATVVTQILKKNQTSRNQLVAFIVPLGTVNEDERHEILPILKQAAKNRLPSYMIPQVFLWIEKVPRSSAGKVDKRILLELFCDWYEKETLSARKSENEYTYKWTELEKKIRKIFSRLSRTPLEDISSSTTIYQLGLDSISAAQIAAALRAQDHSVSAADVMKHANCNEIAIFLNKNSLSVRPHVISFDFEALQSKYKAVILESKAIDENFIDSIRPCTPLQQGMLSQFLAKDGAVYMNYLCMRLEPTTNLDKLRLAWTTIMKRHEILRTGFGHVDDALYPFFMVQYTPKVTELPWHDISENEDSPPSDEWLENLQRTAANKLHLPLWKLRIIKDGTDLYLDLGMFHGLFDARSLQSIFNEVVAAYNAQPLPKCIPLDPVLGHILNSRKVDPLKREQFWKQLGKNANANRFPNLAPLRLDSMPPMVQSRFSARSSFDLEGGCRDAGITIQAAGIASWLSLLSAYTGEQSVTCGVVLSGRDFEAAEGAVFPCINTVPFACVVTPDRTELLNKVMKLNAELQEHQRTPLSEAQKWMGHPTESLFDTIFAYQKLPNHNNENNLWTVVDEKSSTEYPISIEMESKQEQLEYRLTFLPHVIPVEHASLILDQFDHLMQYLIFSATDSQVDITFNSLLHSITPAKEPILPSEATLLHEMVEFTAFKYPQRIAFEFADTIDRHSRSSRRWTYDELNEEGNRIAHLIICRGVLPGDLIGMCFNKCPEASFVTLGILKAGCAFVAIDPGAPAARQAFVLQDSQPRVILSMAKESAQFKDQVDVPIVNLDEITTHSLPKSKPFLTRDISPQDRSYCLYTSGSTGLPKGCELTHENAVSALLAFQRLFAGHWDAESRWLQFASFHFDVSVLEQYWSWSVGICVVSAPRDLIFEDVAKAINILGITHIDLTPSLAQLLHPDDVPSLCRGVFITGGESLKQEILDVWGQKQVIYNGYGPTEATIGVTMYPRVPRNGKPSNIGPQFDNVGSFVLHPGSDVPVLRGGVGELCVSGKLVGRGYLNRPELTAERFPYLDRFGERVYRTGDLVRILYDGSFDFLGRSDDQVKLRGQRLEVGEINSVIMQSGEEISNVATLVLKHPEQQKQQLVSFVVMGRRSTDAPKIIWSNAVRMIRVKEGCHSKLPPYMIPTHFIPLSNMPLNVNNKSDGRKLRQMYETLSGSDLRQLSVALSEDDQPWSEQELRLREVLAKSLNIGSESISKNSSFFELGMDSISVINVSRALQSAGFTNATASTVLQHSTVHRLRKALAIEEPTVVDRGSILAAQQAITAFQHRHRREVARSLAIDQSHIESIAPCTPLQQGIIAKYLESEVGLYFNSFHFKLKNEIDEKRLRLAWEEVYASTPILRTALVDTEDGYIQAVLRGKSLRWSGDNVLKNDSYVDGSSDPSQRKRRRFSQIELRKPFRILSVRTPQQRLVVVHMFHGLYDGYSIGLIFKAVWDVYNGRKRQKDVPSFHSALAYGPLRVIKGAQGFWVKHLSNAPSASFPTLSSQSGDQPVIVERQLQELKSFESLRKKLGVTAQAIGQACWLSTLQLFAKAKITTGIVVSGRSIDLEGADAIIGPMFNTIPYKHDVDRHETWAALIKRVHDFNTAAHPYQHTALRDIMKWCNRSPSKPFFDTLFVFKVIQDDEEWAKNHAWEILDRGGITDYALAFEIEQREGDCFSLTLVTQGHISNEQTSNELLDCFEEALRQVLTDPMDILDMSEVMDDFIENETQVDEDPVNGPDGAVDYQWTGNANILREEIARLCGIETNEITETTSIFELGLDSIDAIKLSSKLKMRRVNLPVSGIMRGLTIAKMDLNILDQDTRGVSNTTDTDLDLQMRNLNGYLQSCHVNTDGIEDILPLTPLQEAMVAEMVSSDYSKYYNHDVLMLDPKTDIAKLQEALERVVKSSPILRTSFVEIEDVNIDHSFAQVIHQQPHDFWSHCGEDYEPDFPVLFWKLRDEAMNTGFLLPLFNVKHVETPEKSYLILSIAHALYDGWSLSLLHSDIQEAYHNRFISRPKYQSALAEILSASGSDAASFWKDFLTGATLSAFPCRPHHLDHNKTNIHRHQQSSRISFADISAFTKKTRVALQSIGQAAFALVLASQQKSLDVTFGTVLSGRDDDQRSQLLFPTMNTVAVRLILHGTRAEMLHYVQETFQNIKQWQHFPLRKALAQAGFGGKLFDSLFIYQKSADDLEHEASRLYTSIQSHSDVEYPLCVEMEVMNEELVWRCAAKGNVFDEHEVKNMLDSLDNVLRQIVDHPDSPVIEFAANGTAICGLAAFNEGESVPRSVSDTSVESAKVVKNHANLQTAAKIRKVLATVSKLFEDDITNDMTIFHIGLDSISAIKVSSKLRKQGIILSVGEMLRAGTVQSMAAFVDARVSPAAEGDNDVDLSVKSTLEGIDQRGFLRAAGIDEDNISETLPVTAGQLYMLSMWINSNGSNFYPEFTYELQGHVALDILRASWQKLIDTNAILRIVFALIDKSTPYVQVVLRQARSSLTNITELAEDQIHEQTRKGASAQPWVHLFVSQRSTGWVLRLRIHHALYDGVSLPLLVRQFQDLCNGIAISTSPRQLTKLVASSCTESALQSRRAFWTNYLVDTKQHLVKALPKSSSRTEIFEPCLLQTSSLEAIAHKHGISVQSLVLAAYGKLYGIVTDTPENQDVIVGLYLANRSLPITGIETAPIPTVNLVPLRIRNGSEQGLLDVATQIQRDLRDVSEAAIASVSLHEIFEWTGVKIGTFVNFLSLPAVEDPAQTGQMGKRIEIRPTTQWQHRVSRIAPDPRAAAEVPSTLVNQHVNGAYIHAIDVEATIRGGGLDIGVFAPTSLFGLEQGEKLINDLRKELTDLYSST